MKFKVGKYAFDSKEQYQAKFDALHTEDEEGNLIPEFRFATVELGNIVLEQATYDEDGEILTEAVLSDDWHVDAGWWGLDDHPYGWKSYKVDFEEGQGMHSFAGVDYQSHKF